MRISIVIPTYNHFQSELKGCLETLVRFTDLSDAEVIVVSNGSTDETNDYVTRMGNPFKLLAYPEPLGYTKATNAGIACARGDFVILYNNDNVLLDIGGWNEWVNILLDPFDQDPKLGITGPSKQWRGGRPWLLFYIVAIKRHLFGELGFLDEAFNPGAGEDTDFCLKALDAGYNVRQVPHELDKSEYSVPFPVWHKGGQTVNEVPGWPQIVARNELILQSRYGMGAVEKPK